MKSGRWLCLIALILVASVPLTHAAVVINELYYDAPGVDTGQEFIELYNNGASAADVSGWVIEWAGSAFPTGFYTIPPSTTIAPGDYLLLGGDLVQGNFGVTPDIIAAFVFQNGGSYSDGVRISDGLGYYDTILYDSPNTNMLPGDDANPGAELCPDVSSGHSLERVTVGVDNNLATDWFDNATPTPTRSSTLPGNNPPNLSNATFYPDIVSYVDEVLVTATAYDDYTLVSVNIQHQVNGGGYSPLTMYDDGLHGDGAANDSVWGRSIAAQSIGDLVEFYVEATDDSGGVSWDPIGGPSGPLSYDVRNIPLSTIVSIKPVDGNGNPIYQDSLVMVVGLVEATDHFGYSGPAYIRDATGGVAVYGTTVTTRNIAIGDSVRVTGWIDGYQGLIELADEPVSGSPEPVFLISSSGHTVDPDVLTIPQIGETTESLLIRINGGHFTVGGNFAYTNYDFVVGTDTIDVRIDNDTDIIGTQIPPGDCDVVGCLSQYVFALPYIGGYQLMPRFTADIITFGNQPPAVGNTVHDPLVPTLVDTVWVTSLVSDDSGLDTVNLHYQVNGGGWFRTQVPMFDDGLHHDGAANDSTYGASIPPYSVNDLVEYYVSAIDDSGATTTDPAGAPGTTYSYTVSAGLTITPISYIRANDPNGEPLRMDSLFTAIGLLTADTSFGDRGPAFLQDATGGIGLYDTEGLTGYGFAIGDSIRITGWVGFSSGVTEFVDDPNNQFNNPVITILNSGNTLTPLVLTIPQVDSTEAHEAEFVVFNNVTFVETGVFNSSTVYNIVSGTDTLALYVDYDTDIAGNPIPTGAVNVQGILSQYDTATPYFDGYQLIPRSITDIGTSGGPVITPISYIRANDGNGAPIRLDSLFTAKALVTSGTELGSSGAAFMQDNTGGIAFYDYTVTTSGIAIGDSIQITAWVGFYNGLTQFVDEPGTGTDPIIIILSSGNTVTPLVVTSITESVEGQHVRVNGGQFVVTGTFASGEYDFVVGPDTLLIYIDSSTDIPGNAIPTGTVDVIGCAGQYDFSSPYFDGYQLIPRMFTDIIVSGLEAVDDLVITKSGDDIILQWSDVFGAADYKVYYAATAGGPYSVLAASTSGNINYTHVGGAADPAVQGFYYVTAVD